MPWTLEDMILHVSRTWADASGTGLKCAKEVQLVWGPTCASEAQPVQVRLNQYQYKWDSICASEAQSVQVRLNMHKWGQTCASEA